MIMLKNLWGRLTTEVRAFIDDEAGLSATEYAILFVVILAFIIAGARLLGPKIQELFSRAADQIP